MSEWTSKIVKGVDADRDRDGATLVFEDATLLRRCSQGDTDAFGSLVRKYQDRLFNAILKFNGNRHDAEELCQETFVKAFESLASFRQASGFYTWLFRIGMNLSISRRRRSGRVKFRSLDAPIGDDEQQRGSEELISDFREIGPHDAAERADAWERIMAAMQELDEEFRIVVVLRDIEDMNYEQISQVLEVPVGTIKSRLYRARCILKEKLADLVG